MKSSLNAMFDELRKKPALEDLDAQHFEQRAAVLIEPNPQNVLEAAQAYAELQRQTTDEETAQFSTAVENLTVIRDKIMAANDTGGLSSENAYFASVATESWLNTLGLEDEQQIVSFESAVKAGDGLATVSVESLDATLESVDSSLKTFGRRAVATLHRLFLPSWILTKQVGKGLEKFITAAGHLKAKPGATIKVKTSSILVGDGPSKHLADDFQKAATILQYMIKTFGDDAKADYAFNTQLTAKLFEENNEASQAETVMTKLYSKWKDPRRKLGGDPSAPLLGNHVLFTDHELKYEGDSAIAKKFDVLANHAYPELIGYTKRSSNNDADSRMIEVPALTPEEIAKIAMTLADAHRAFGFWASKWEDLKAATTVATVAGGLLAFTNFVTFPVFAAWTIMLHIKVFRREGDMETKAGDGWFAEDVRTVYDATVTASRMGFHVPHDASRVLRITTRLFKKLAAASMAAHASTSTEAFDNATATVGVSVNETAPNEPTQAPPPNNQAPVGEVAAHQPSFQDNPESHQDLNGNVHSTESVNPVPYWYRA